MKEQYYVCLEITSKSVKMVVGDALKDQVYIIDAVEECHAGVQKGVINDPKLVEEAIKSVKEKIEKNISMKIKDVTLVVPSFGLKCMPDSLSFYTASRDGVIENNDIRNIITMMKKKTLADSSLKIIDCVPSVYVINGNERFYQAPLGKRSEQIILSAYLYALNEKILNTYLKLVQNVGLNVVYYVASACAGALYLSTLNKIPDEYIMIDIGHSLTNVVYVTDRKDVRASELIAFGGDSITKSISEKLDISYEEAENLKVTYGIENNLAFPVLIKGNYSFDDLSDAIYASFNSYFAAIQNAIKRFNVIQDGNVPVMLTGGGSKLNGLDKLLSSELNLDIIKYDINTLGARDKSFVNVLGAIKYSKVQPVVEDEEQVVSTITRVDVFAKRKLGDLEDEL